MLATLEPVPDQIAIPIDPAVAQTWIDDPATNHGLLLETSPDGHYHLHASDSTLDGMTTRPELAVDVAE